MSSRSSVDRAPAQCSGGHGLVSCQGLNFFSFFHALVMLISSLFTKNHLSCSYIIAAYGALVSKWLTTFYIFSGYIYNPLTTVWFLVTNLSKSSPLKQFYVLDCELFFVFMCYLFQLQVPQNLHAACLSLPKPPPVLKHPGSYHQQRTGMESSQDLNFTTKRKVLQIH